MQTKHTPGPWNVDSCSDNNEHYAISAGHPHGEFIWKELATVYNHEEDSLKPQSLANAHLISAAPDLLNALIYMRDRFVPNGDNEACKQADEAIKKATQPSASSQLK